MKLVTLLGSPRLKGNSATIAERFCDTARDLGAEVQIFALNELEYRGCQGCMICKTKLDRCVLDDDLTAVLDAVRVTDVLLLASPVYYGDLSSQLKGFIDRTFSYLVPDYVTNPQKSRLSPGKKLVLVLTQGNPDEEQFADVFPRYDYFLRMYGFDYSRVIRACGVRRPDEARGREDVMHLAEYTAAQLFGRT